MHSVIVSYLLEICYNFYGEIMKIVSYNINGIRASSSKGLIDWIRDENADIYCFQEVRADGKTVNQIFSSTRQISLFSPICAFPYKIITNCGKRPGYAGTMILTKTEPLKIVQGIEQDDDIEGRTLTLYFKDFVLINSYVPNGNTRLDFKYEYIKKLQTYILNLSKTHNVIFCSDFNIAHTPLDLTHPKECSKHSGFLLEERDVLSKFIENLNLIDTLRYFHNSELLITWRSYRSLTEKNYNAWKYRFDYILASKTFEQNLLSSNVLDVNYSDHLPIIMEIEI